MDCLGDPVTLTSIPAIRPFWVKQGKGKVEGVLGVCVQVR